MKFASTGSSFDLAHPVIEKVGMAIAPRDAALVAQSKETPAFREFVRERGLHSNLEQHARSKVRLQLSPPDRRQGPARSAWPARACAIP